MADAFGHEAQLPQLIDTTIAKVAAALRAHSTAAAAGHDQSHNSVEGAAVSLLRALREYQSALSAGLGQEYEILDAEDLERSYFDASAFEDDDRLIASPENKTNRWILSSEWIFVSSPGPWPADASDGDRVRLELLRSFEDNCNWPWNSPTISGVELVEHRYRASGDKS